MTCLTRSQTDQLSLATASSSRFQKTTPQALQVLVSLSRDYLDTLGVITKSRKSAISTLFRLRRKFKKFKLCKSGTGAKMMKNGPKHIMDAEDLEPLYTPQINILEDCLRREAERVAH